MSKDSVQRITVKAAKERGAHQYRITRPSQYLAPTCSGHNNAGARQGYYIYADTAKEAVREMARDFPYDIEFDVQEWT